MVQSAQYTYTKISEQRGKKRLWLQGLRLADCGFERGARYRVDYLVDKREIHLVLDANGDRQVSGRRRGAGYDPIVDICNAEVVRFAGECARVRAEFRDGRIIFSISHLDAKRAEREQRFREELANGRIKEGTLCAGIGMATQALHEGLKRGGVQGEVAWICDRERRYLQVACDNNEAVRPTTKIFEASIEELEPELLDPVSILQASLPCTGHSPAGKAKNKLVHAEGHRTDATAVFGMLRIIEATQPSVIVSENVIPARTSATFLLLKGMLEAMDYVIHEVELGPEQSGSLEARRRYWFVAVSKGLGCVDLNSIPVFDKDYATLGDLLEPMADDDPRWCENQYLKDKQVRDAKAGKGYAVRQLLDGSATQIGTAGRGYQKRRSAEPFLTRADGKERLLTPLELCRAHGAPASLIRNTSDGVAYEGLGQGIAWNHAVGIGEVLARDLREGRSTHEPVSCDDIAVTDVDERQLSFFDA